MIHAEELGGLDLLPGEYAGEDIWKVWSGIMAVMTAMFVFPLSSLLGDRGHAGESLYFGLNSEIIY